MTRPRLPASIPPVAIDRFRANRLPPGYTETIPAGEGRKLPPRSPGIVDPFPDRAGQAGADAVWLTKGGETTGLRFHAGQYGHSGAGSRPPPLRAGPDRRRRGGRRPDAGGAARRAAFARHGTRPGAEAPPLRHPDRLQPRPRRRPRRSRRSWRRGARGGAAVRIAHPRPATARGRSAGHDDAGGARGAAARGGRGVRLFRRRRHRRRLGSGAGRAAGAGAQRGAVARRRGGAPASRVAT